MISRLNNYIHLRQKGISMFKSFTASPISRTEKLMLTITIIGIICAILIAYLQNANAQVADMRLNATLARLETINAVKDMQTYEKVIIDVLNGEQIKIDGRLKTVCVLNAAGDCE